MDNWRNIGTNKHGRPVYAFYDFGTIGYHFARAMESITERPMVLMWNDTTVTVYEGMTHAEVMENYWLRREAFQRGGDEGGVVVFTKPHEPVTNDND